MLCKKCGGELDESALFCRFCGNKIEKQVTIVEPAEPISKVDVQSKVEGDFESQKSANVDNAFDANNNELVDIGSTYIEYNKNSSGKSKAKYKLILIAIIIIAVIISAVAISDQQYVYPENDADYDYGEMEEIPSEDFPYGTENEFVDEYDNMDSSYTTDVYIESVSASSVLEEIRTTHWADRVCDNDASTAWVEGSPGDGIGESLTIYFDTNYLIEKIAINAGYQKSPELYLKNGRPNRITLSFSGGTKEIHYLDDINDVQYIKLDESVVTDKVIITIDTVYPGSVYEDTCISEISFNT